MITEAFIKKILEDISTADYYHNDKFTIILNGEIINKLAVEYKNIKKINIIMVTNPFG